MALHSLQLSGVVWCKKGLVLLSELFSLAPLLFSFLKAASQSPDCGEYYFLLGRLYWDMGEETRKDRSKAHTHLLKVGTVIILHSW